MKARTYRMIFDIDGEPAGSMLVVHESAEKALSIGCQHVEKTSGKRPEVVSIGRVFMSDAEEIDYLNIIAMAKEK